MSVVVSFDKSGPQLDVLRGSLLQSLPALAPSYDVTLRAVSLSTTPKVNGLMTLLAGPTALMQNSRIINGIHGPGVSGGDNAYLYNEPFVDVPTITTNLPAATRLTLNVSGIDSADVMSYYVEAVEAQDPHVAPAYSHTDYINLVAAGSNQDILSGTPVSDIPAFGSVWNVAVYAGCLFWNAGSAKTATDFPRDVTATLIVGTDTICEQFTVRQGSSGHGSTVNPIAGYPFEDPMIETLATPGDKITLNLQHPTPYPAATAGGAYFYYRVELDLVA